MKKEQKTIIIIIFTVIAVLLLIGLFIKKDYEISRSITINRPQIDVFNYLKYIKNQKNYHTLNLMDPDMRLSYNGKDAMSGFISTWESENKDLGIGEQVILNIDDSIASIETELRFHKPYSGKAKSIMKCMAISKNESVVTWTFKSKIAYPMNLILYFTNTNDSIAKDLDIGLKSLRDLLEGKRKDKKNLVHYGLNIDSVKTFLTEKYHGKILKIVKFKSDRYLFQRKYKINNRAWLPLVKVTEELELDTEFIKNLEIDFNIYNLKKPAAYLRTFQVDEFENIKLTGSFRFKNYKDSNLKVYRLELLPNGKINTDTKLFKRLLDFGIQGLETDIEPLEVDSIAIEENR